MKNCKKPFLNTPIVNIGKLPQFFCTDHYKTSFDFANFKTQTASNAKYTNQRQILLIYITCKNIDAPLNQSCLRKDVDSTKSFSILVCFSSLF